MQQNRQRSQSRGPQRSQSRHQAPIQPQPLPPAAYTHGQPQVIYPQPAMVMQPVYQYMPASAAASTSNTNSSFVQQQTPPAGSSYQPDLSNQGGFKVPAARKGGIYNKMRATQGQTSNQAYGANRRRDNQGGSGSQGRVPIEQRLSRPVQLPGGAQRIEDRISQNQGSRGVPSNRDRPQTLRIIPHSKRITKGPRVGGSGPYNATTARGRGGIRVGYGSSRLNRFVPNYRLKDADPNSLPYLGRNMVLPTPNPTGNPFAKAQVVKAYEKSELKGLLVKAELDKLVEPSKAMSQLLLLETNGGDQQMNVDTNSSLQNSIGERFRKIERAKQAVHPVTIQLSKKLKISREKLDHARSESRFGGQRQNNEETAIRNSTNTNYAQEPIANPEIRNENSDNPIRSSLKVERRFYAGDRVTGARRGGYGSRRGGLNPRSRIA